MHHKSKTIMDEVDEMIRAFRGLPKSCSKPRDRRVKTIEEIMERISKRYRIEDPRIEETIMRNWRNIVGSARAHRCKPSKIIDGHTLLITTTNATLRMELQFDQAMILKNLHHICGADAVRSVIIR